MSEKILTRNDIVTMLAWQHDMGIDEAILDQPDRAERLLEFDDVAPRLSQCEMSIDLSPKMPEASKSASQKHPASAIPASLPKNLFIPANSSGQQHLSPHDHAVGIASGLAFDNLPDLRSGLAAMENCALKHTASNLCFADGNAGARLMIIGEVPGRDEDRIGMPFVGATGQLLDRMLASIGLDRSSVYLTTLFPWRPPGNRTPTDEEIAMLLPWLYRHVQLANPDMLLLLGGAAAKLVFNAKEGILKLRGKWKNVDFGDGVLRPVLASLHPSYLIRSPAQKRLAFDDLLSLAARLSND